MVANHTYRQGVATLGFQGGPSVTFRLNPNEIKWNFEVHTSVSETVGGRVVQVLGASLSDLTIFGSFGEVRNGRNATKSHTLAENFLASMKRIAEYQSRQSTRHSKMHAPAVFSYPPNNWRFAVYVKDLSDPDGGGVTHRSGKFAHDYVLTLMIHDDLSDTAQILGGSNGVIAVNRDKAIASYISRIADGIGWRASEFNGHLIGEKATAGSAPSNERRWGGGAFE